MWLFALLATSAMPKVIVVFENSKDAAALELPSMLVTSLAYNWSTYDCANVATSNGEVVCKRKRIACLPQLGDWEAELQSDVFQFSPDRAAANPVPLPAPAVLTK